MAIVIPDFETKSKIVIPNFKVEEEEEEKKIKIPTFEDKEPTTQFEKDFSNMSNEEIIATGGKGYTEEEREKNIKIPNFEKSGLIADTVPITFKQIKYNWEEPLGLSPDNRKKLNFLIGDENTLLGKFNAFLLDNTSKGIDVGLRSLNTVALAATGLAGDGLNFAYEILDKEPGGAGERLTRDLNIALIEIMGRSGSGSAFQAISKKPNTIKSKRTGEEITDIVTYANKSPENKIEVKKDIHNIVNKELTEIRKKDQIIGESLNIKNITEQTNKVNEIINFKDKPIEEIKTIDTPASLKNRTPALPVETVNKFVDASLQFLKEENIKFVPEKNIPISKQMSAKMQEVFLSDTYNVPFVIKMIAEDNKLAPKDFLDFIFPSVSQSAKEMAAWSKASRYIRNQLDPTGQLVQASGKPILHYLKRLDNLRRGLLVTRIATAVRNYGSQTMRVTTDSLQNIIDFFLQQAIKPFIDPVTFQKNKVSPMTSLDQLVTNFRQWRPKNFKETKKQTEKFLDLFPKEKNRLFLRYSSDIAAATKGKSKGKVNKFLDTAQEGVDLLNFFNKTQEFITRRAVVLARLDEIIRANPKRYNAKTLEQLLREGRQKELRVSDVAAAVDKALEITFAKEFNQYKQGGSYENFAAGLISIINKAPFVLTALVPFPRFLFNALRFHAEFSPFGFLRFLTRADRQKIAKGDTSGLSRALIGTGMLFAAMALRRQDYAGEKWYEFKIGNRTIDTRPYNPFAAYLFVADVINRSIDGTLRDVDVKDIITVFAGVRGTTGLYVFDQIADWIANSDKKIGEAKWWKRFKKFTGELFAGYLTPIQNITDVMAQFYPEMRKSKSTRGEEFTGAFKKRLVSGDLETATSATNYIINEKTGKPEAAPIVKEEPLIGQFTGLRFITPKNPAEKELDRLQFKYYEIFRSTGIPELDKVLKDYISYQIGYGISKMVETPIYKSKTFNEKVYLMKKALASIKRSAKEVARDDASLAPYLLQYDLNNLSREERNLIDDAIGFDYIEALLDGLKNKK